MNEKQISSLEEVDINKLKPYTRNAYKEFEGKKLEDMVESIKEYGVTDAILVRPIDNTDFNYEIISGHNRVKAGKLAELKTIPAQIRELTNAQADILMVESNSMRRHEILPSEKGKAYKAYLEAHNKQGTRNDLISLDITSGRIGHKSTRGELAVLYEETETQIRRYIDLVRLIPDILQLVDDKKLSMNPAVNISILSNKEQKIVLRMIKESPRKLSMAASANLRDTKLKKMGEKQKEDLTENEINSILNPPMGNDDSTVKSKIISFPPKLLSEYFNDDEQDDEAILEKIEKALKLLADQKSI